MILFIIQIKENHHQNYEKSKIQKYEFNNQDPSKQKPKNYIQQLKQGDDNICDAVLDTLSEDYLSYISGMVKISKTPPKKAKQLKNQQKLQDSQLLAYQNKTSPVLKHKIVQEDDVKNQTMKIKKKQNINEDVWRNVQFPNNKKRCSLTRNTNQSRTIENNHQFYDQKVTQPDQRKSVNTLGLHSQQGTDTIQKAKFIQNIDEYLLKLQSRRQSSHKQNVRSALNAQEILLENHRLKKQVKLYEEKIEDLQQSVNEHLNYCRKKDKGNKNKINDLIKALAQAINKINKQKQQIHSLTGLFKNFGRKVEVHRQHEDDSGSQIEQQINQSLTKAMRPTRVRSEYKVSKKKPLNLVLGKMYEGEQQDYM